MSGMVDRLRRQRLAKLLNDFASPRNMSQAMLANYFGVSQPAVGSWLNESADPLRDSLEKIAEGLALSYEELIAKLDDKPIVPRQSIDLVLQEIRVMPTADFVRVVQVVAERTAQQLQQSSEKL
jgi:transcriptional regulator with XRE-family HTH domain